MKESGTKRKRGRELGLGLLWGVVLFLVLWAIYKLRPDLFLD